MKLPEQQELLFKAICLPETRALSSWESWRQRFDINTVTAETHALLPAAYKRVLRLNPDDSELSILGEIYKKNFLISQLRQQTVRSVLAHFRKESMSPMLLKGAVAASQLYPDPGARVVDEIDVLVKYDRAKEALAWLEMQGWQILQEDWSTERCFYELHRTVLQHADGCKLGLHWHVLDEYPQQSVDSLYYETAEQRELLGVPILISAPAESLLLAVAEAQSKTDFRNCWVLDIFYLGESIHWRFDWDSVFVKAKECRVLHHLKQVLPYLARTLEFPISDSVLARLNKQRAGVQEILREYSSSSTTGNSASGLSSLFYLYLRLHAPRSSSGPVVGFFDFLKRRWDLEHYGQLPKQAVIKALANSSFK